MQRDQPLDKVCGEAGDLNLSYKSRTNPIHPNILSFMRPYIGAQKVYLNYNQ